MSEFIFDQIYGSEARRRKIMEGRDFIYYRQMMMIKNKHINNQSLYKHVYKVPQQIPVTQSQYRPASTQLFASLNQSNYAIQKINSHAFKILKKKQKSLSTNNKQKERTLLSLTQRERGFLNLDSNRKLTSRTIDGDAKNLRNYFQKDSKTGSRNRVRNLSMDLEQSRAIKTNSRLRKTNFSFSPFSTISSPFQQHKHN